MDPLIQPNQESRTWALFCHLSPILGAGFVGPLVIWLIRKDTDPFVDEHGKEALSFQIALTVAVFVLALAGIVTLGLGMILTIPATLALVIAALVFSIMGTVKASEGQPYRYPFSIRLIK